MPGLNTRGLLLFTNFHKFFSWNATSVHLSLGEDFGISTQAGFTHGVKGTSVVAYLCSLHFVTISLTFVVASTEVETKNWSFFIGF